HVHYAYPSGSSWTSKTVYTNTQTTAALGITWNTTDTKRIYYITTTGTDQVFVATQNTDGTWTSQSAAPGVSADRLAVQQNTDGKDILYLPDTTHNTLYYAQH
ncbi:hypothetical protein EAO76_22080, partial [Streptomyces sp. sk2.1]